MADPRPKDKRHATRNALLGKVDAGLRTPETPLDIASVGASARLLEDIGYDGMAVEETKDDPFLAAVNRVKCSVAGEVADGVGLQAVLHPEGYAAFRAGGRPEVGPVPY